MITQPRLILSGIPNLLPSLNRSPGLHLSDVIRDLAIRQGYLKVQEDESGPNMTRMQLGLALEHALAIRWHEEYPDHTRIWQPGEVMLDDLPVTPDFYNGGCIGDVECSGPDEVKLTWKSSGHDPLSSAFWMYRVQLMAQAKALRSDNGRLHACHMAGDYKEIREPVYNVWDFRWTERELIKNRDMLLSHRDTMLREEKRRGSR